VPSVSYEVTATVRADLVARYEAYMSEKHIREVLATGAFVVARLERAEPGRYRIRYEAATRDDLDRYLSTHAPRLRADALAHFPEGVELSREEWTRVADFALGAPPRDA